MRVLAALIVTALVSGAAWSGYRYVARHAASQTASQSGPAAPAVLGPKALVFFRVDEPSGRVDMIGETASKLGLAGSPPKATAGAFPGWRVQEASAARVILVPAEGQKPFTVGLKSGFVTIYVGAPERDLVQQVTGISARGLMPQDRTRLTAGIRVASLADAWRLLEGLAGGA